MLGLLFLIVRGFVVCYAAEAVGFVVHGVVVSSVSAGLDVYDDVSGSDVCV